MAKFKNENVNLGLKNNGLQNFTQSLGIRTPTPPYLGIIPEKKTFLVLPIYTLRDISVEVNDLFSSLLRLANFVEHILLGALHLDNCPQLLLTSSLCLLIPREEEKEKKGDNETGGRSKGGISWLERGETED